MAVQKITTKDFTVFENINIDIDAGINLIIGENGVGKTHLLKLIYAVGLIRTEYPVAAITAITDGSWGLQITSKVTDIDSISSGNISEISATGRPKIIALPVEMEPDAKEIYVKKNYPHLTGAIYEAVVESDIPYDAVFIPCKDMLSHSKGLPEMADKHGANMPFDRFYLDIIKLARRWELKTVPDIAKSIVPTLEKVIEGKVVLENDTFYVQKNDGRVIPFSNEAEGIKKFGLLWLLLMNESITKDTVLLWDEPENSISPKYIPVLVEAMLELQRQGVQIIATTHSYNFMKYFSVKKEKADKVAFFSLIKDTDGKVRKCEREDDYDLLEHNSIIEANTKLLEDEIERVL